MIFTVPVIPKPNNLPGPSTGGDGVEFFVSFLGNLAVSLLGIMGILAVMFIIFGALKIIVSGGDQDKAKGGWTTITNAVIGLLIASLSYAIVQMVVQLPYEVMKTSQSQTTKTPSPDTKNTQTPGGFENDKKNQNETTPGGFENDKKNQNETTPGGFANDQKTENETTPGGFANDQQGSGTTATPGGFANDKQ